MSEQIDSLARACAERDRYQAEGQVLTREIERQVHRADAAEAKRDDWRKRALGAEGDAWVSREVNRVVKSERRHWQREVERLTARQAALEEVAEADKALDLAEARLAQLPSYDVSGLRYDDWILALKRLSHRVEDAKAARFAALAALARLDEQRTSGSSPIVPEADPP